jgi:Ca-activated chloride channel family protein
LKDAVTTPLPGRIKATRRRKRRLRTKSLVFIAVAACVLLMIGRGTAQIVSHFSCANDPLVINVAVSTDITPAVEEIAATFNREQHQTSGRCIAVQIDSGSPAVAAGQIDGQHPNASGGQINAWIPDSSLWVDEVRGYYLGAKTVSPAGFSVARSPLMIVMPTQAADRTPAFGKDGWRLLLPPGAGGPSAPKDLRVDLPDPSQTAAGLATLIEESRLLGANQGGRVKFTKFVHNAAVTSYFDDPVSLASLVSLAAPPLNGDPVTITTEQAVIAYDTANPRQPLAAVYPTGKDSSLGSPEFDYPYVLLTSSSQAQLTAANIFGQMLRSKYAASVIRFAGFRSAGHSAGEPDQFASSYGLDSQLLQIAPPASALEAPSVLQSWSKLEVFSRDLVQVDISSNMNKSSAPGDPTYESELSQAATIGLALFADTSNIGLWEYADHLNGVLPYKNVMSIGPLPAQVGLLTRRAALVRINQNLTATNISNAALYGTILAGYKYLLSTYQPKFFNALIVLGSGVENAPGDITAQQLLKDLSKLSSPQRKISIIMVIFGQPPNYPQLQQIAAATGGQAYSITKSSQVFEVFYEALAHRLCSPSC